MSCQDELSHMNEKLLLTEDASIKFKTKVDELKAHVESLMNRTPMKLDIENIFKKVGELMDFQKDSEKSLIEHERSRFQDSTYDTANDKSLDTTEDFGATEALKQNALATQLASLNKQLAQKEQYAENLSQQEDKLREIRKQYEEKLVEMESQMKLLEKEKGELMQQNRSEPASSKIAEQRRKRIQELEGSMSDLRKKLIGKLAFFYNFCCSFLGKINVWHFVGDVLTFAVVLFVKYLILLGGAMHNATVWTFELMLNYCKFLIF